MPKRIQEDWKKFRDVVSGRTRRELKRLIKSGAIVRSRPKGGKMTISIPEIEIPHFVHGSTGDGVGRGPGEEGDVVGRDPQPGQGGGQAGTDPGEGIHIQVDMEDILKFMQDELKLPRMLPKPNETFEEIRIKYNDISKTGLNALRHPRRTMKEALKRLAMMGRLDEAQDFVSKALEFNPKMTVELWRKRFQYKDPKHTKRIIDALRRAGLPD